MVCNVQNTYFLCLQRLQDNCGLSRRLLDGKRALPLAVVPGPHSGSLGASSSDILCKTLGTFKVDVLCLALYFPHEDDNHLTLAPPLSR